MLTGSIVHLNAPRRNMDEQLFQSTLREDDEAKQTMREFPITAKVRTA